MIFNSRTVCYKQAIKEIEIIFVSCTLLKTGGVICFFGSWFDKCRSHLEVRASSFVCLKRRFVCQQLHPPFKERFGALRKIEPKIENIFSFARNKSVSLKTNAKSRNCSLTTITGSFHEYQHIQKSIFFLSNELCCEHFVIAIY